MLLRYFSTAFDFVMSPTWSGHIYIYWVLYPFTAAAWFQPVKIHCFNTAIEYPNILVALKHHKHKVVTFHSWFTNDLFSMSISSGCVCSAFKLLKPHKHDGTTLMSDHLILAEPVIADFVATLVDLSSFMFKTLWTVLCICLALPFPWKFCFLLLNKLSIPGLSGFIPGIALSWINPKIN